MLYKKPGLRTYSAEAILEKVGPIQAQYTGTLTIYGVKSAMYSPTEQVHDAVRLVHLNEVKDKIA